MVVEGGVKGVGEEAQGRHGETAGAAAEIADLQGKDHLRRFWRPGSRRGVKVGAAVRADGVIITEGAQGPLDGGHGEARAGVEGARALAGAAPPDDVPFTRQDDPDNELARLAANGSFMDEATLRCETASGLADEPAHGNGTARPEFRAGARRMAFVAGLRDFFLCSGLLINQVGFTSDCILLAAGIFVIIIVVADMVGVVIRSGNSCALLYLTFFRGSVLHFLQEFSQSPVIHRLKAGEGQRRLVAHGEKDDGIAVRGRL